MATEFLHDIPKTAVIVAAGQSSRLYPLTEHKPKGLLPLGRTTILGRSIALLKESGIKKIAVVTGFQRSQIQDHLGFDGIDYIYNPFFKETNNMASLWFAKEWVTLQDDPHGFLYLHNDIAYDASILPKLLKSLSSQQISLVVEEGSIDEEAMKVELKEGLFFRSSKDIPKSHAYGEWIGMAHIPSLLTKALFSHIDQLLSERHFQDYDTSAFNRMARDRVPFSIVTTDGKPWVEVDFLKDYQKAQELFT